MHIWRPFTLALVGLSGCVFDPAGIAVSGDGDAGVDAAVDVDVDAAVDASVDASVDAGGDPGLPPGYVAYFRFDVDASDVTGNHNGTLAGGAAITTGGQGVLGEALILQAQGDRVDIGDPTGFDFNSDFTWHAYIKTRDGSGAIIARNPLNSEWNQGSKALFVRGDTVQWDTGWVGNPETDVNVIDDQWHQVIVTFVAATDALKVFVDPDAGDTMGDYDGTHEVDRFDEHTHFDHNGLAHTGLSIGDSTITSGLPNIDTLQGLIDEVVIYDRALSGAELDQLIEFARVQ